MQKVTKHSILSFRFIVFLVIALTACSANSGYAFESQPGRFSVLFPSKPKEWSKFINTKYGKSTIYAFDVIDGTAAYSVTYLDYPETRAPDDSTAYYDSVRDEIAGRSGHTLVSESDSQFDITAGRTLTFELTTKIAEHGYLKIHLVLVGNRYYFLGYNEYISKFNSADADRFFNSFKMIPNTSKDNLQG